MPLKPPVDLTDNFLHFDEDVIEVNLDDYLPAHFVSDSTDVTSAIQNWGSAAQAAIDAGSGVRMIYGADIYRFTAVTGTTPIIRLEGATGLEITGSGTFADQRTGYFAASTTAWFLRVYNCQNIRAKLRLTSEPQYDTVGESLPLGLTGFEMYQGCTVDQIDMEMVGGRTAVSCVKLFNDPESYKVRGGRINVRTNGVFYSYAAQFSGCDNEVRIDADTPARAFTIYGVENTTIYARAKNQALHAYCGMYNAKGCSNIEMHWTDRESTVSTYGINLHYRGTTAATHRDIRIHLDTLQGVGTLDSRAFLLHKTLDNGSTVDSTGRGHLLDGLKITGSVEFLGGPATRDMIRHGSAGELVATGTPDIMRGLEFSNLIVKSSAPNDRSIFRATCLDGIAHVRNVYSTQDFMVENQTSGRVHHAGSTAKRFSQDATDKHTYLDCVVSGAAQVAGVSKRSISSTGTNLNTPTSVVAAATLVVPDSPLVIVTGNTNITAITARTLDVPVTLKFSGTPTVSATATVKLSGGANFVATADDTLTLMCDGTTWWEVARSVNA